jgi:phosphotransferase system HPr-like phosphotransfer protein
LEPGYQGYSTFMDVFMGLHHRSALHFREFVDTFQDLVKMEIEE